MQIKRMNHILLLWYSSSSATVHSSKVSRESRKVQLYQTKHKIQSIQKQIFFRILCSAEYDVFFEWGCLLSKFFGHFIQETQSRLYVRYSLRSKSNKIGFLYDPACGKFLWANSLLEVGSESATERRDAKCKQCPNLRGCSFFTEFLRGVLHWS